MKHLVLFLLLVSSIWASHQIVVVTKEKCADCVKQMDAFESNLFQLFLRENGIDLINKTSDIPDDYVIIAYPAIYLVDEFGMVYATYDGYTDTNIIIDTMTEKYVYESK